MKVKSESEVAQSRWTLHDPTDCSPPGSSARRIFQTRVLEWVAIAFPNLAVQPYPFVLLQFLWVWGLDLASLVWVPTGATQNWTQEDSLLHYRSWELASKLTHVLGRTISCMTKSTVLLSDKGPLDSLKSLLSAFAYGPVHLIALERTQNPPQTCSFSDLPVCCISFASLFWCICLLWEVDPILCFKFYITTSDTFW